MMRLMVEQVLQDIGDPLRLRLAAGGLVGGRAIQRSLVVSGDDRDQALVLRGASAGKLVPVIVDDRIQPVGMLTLPGQSTQPYPIRQEQVVERTVQAGEE